MKAAEETLDWKTIVLFVVFFVVVFFFWYSPLIYPIKMFVVLMHELSHGLAAVITGGSIISIKLDYRIGGLCTNIGGNRFIVASAGYLGSLFWGGLILVITSRTRFSYVIAFALGIMATFVTFFYIPFGSGWLFSLLFSAGLIAISLWTPHKVSKFILMFIGFTSCLYVVIDIWEDLFTLQNRGSDADVIASITHIPAIFWGVLWSMIAIAGVIFYLYLAIPRQRENSDKKPEKE